MESSPLHKLDCCLVTDGAGAFVMTSAPSGRSDLAKPPVYVLGAATCHDHTMISQMPDLTTTPGAICGPAAFAMAGIKPDDVDVLMGYDSFTITALLHLEDLGFCAKGEGGPFVEDGKLGPGRRRCRRTRTAAGCGTRTRHVRHVPHRRSGPPAARRVRRTPGRGPADRGRARLRQRAVDAWARSSSGRRPEHDNCGRTAWSRKSPLPFWDATAMRRLVFPWCTVCDRAVLVSAPEVCPRCLDDQLEWSPRRAPARCTR